ncbi:MAG: RNA 2',3'-cyclic phosphodiesterase [Rhodothermales bacterium]|nr:RNA 2',3'-cyclic phosphodiesterase [Rhodothermales bacterium]
MARLFTGIMLPDAAASETRTLRTDAAESDVRWMPAGNLHATLVFIGDTPDSNLPQIRDLLARIELHPFEVSLRGVGAYPRPNAARVLWAGLKPANPLIDLRDRLTESLASMSEPTGAASREYHPHVTIGRTRGRSRIDARPWIERHAEFSGRPFVVKRFALVHSRTKPDGAEYTVLTSFGGGHNARPS